MVSYVVLRCGSSALQIKHQNKNEYSMQKLGCLLSLAFVFEIQWGLESVTQDVREALAYSPLVSVLGISAPLLNG